MCSTQSAAVRCVYGFCTRVCLPVYLMGSLPASLSSYPNFFSHVIIVFLHSIISARRAFIIAGLCCPTRYLFCFPTSLTASRKLHSADEIGAEFIKEYSVDDCMNINSPPLRSFYLSFENMSSGCRDISDLPHVVFWFVGTAVYQISWSTHVSCIIYQKLAALMKWTLHPTRRGISPAPLSSSIWYFFTHSSLT